MGCRALGNSGNPEPKCTHLEAKYALREDANQRSCAGRNRSLKAPERKRTPSNSSKIVLSALDGVVC